MKELYEKIKLYGESNLSDLELLNVLLDSKNNNIYNYYLDTIMKQDRYSYLYDIEYKDLIDDYNFKEKDAIRLIALREFAKRINKPICKEIIQIKSPKDIFNIFENEFKYEKIEIVKVVILNNKNIIKRIFEMTSGKTDRVDIDPKIIITEVLKTKYNKMILVHNHPSGCVEPSNEDIRVTNHLKNISELLGIKFLDHIIIGENEYRSII